jgi:hypothetical protein
MTPIPTIDPKWRTTPVLELCRAMREAQEFSALVILAAALQDADCTDQRLLDRLRAGPTDYVADVTLVAVVMDPDAVRAIRFIEALAAEIGAPRGYNEDDDVSFSSDSVLTYADLIEVARENVPEPGPEADTTRWRRGGRDYIDMGTNETYKNVFTGKRKKEFWEHFTIITGLVNRNEHTGLFSCSC